MLRNMDEESKLEKFKLAVFSEVNLKTDQIKKEAEAFKKSELEKNKDAQLLKSYNEIQKKSQEITKKYRREVAKFSLDSKRELLIKRNELTQKVFHTVSDKLLNFICSDKYQSYLTNELTSASKTYALSNVTIYIGQNDYKNVDNLKKAYSLPCTFEEDKSIRLGGFIIKDTNKNLYLDNTLKTKLDEQKAYFIHNSRLSL